MRIVSGEFKGRRLAAPRGRDVRPTSDKVREALFSILGSVDGDVVIDLFAGTGALGIEALSRGAAKATFVELDRQALEVVNRNIDATLTRDHDRCEVIKGDAARVVRTLALAQKRFDLVFFDPPYEQTSALVAAMIDTLPTICSQDSRIVLELATRHRDVIEQSAQGWGAEVVLERTYGDTVIAVLRLDGSESMDPSADVVSGSEGD